MWLGDYSDEEAKRLLEDERRERNWKRWGPYLSERQWATVREDYSADGDVWGHFPHDHARSRAYRWGEDGLFGFSDRRCRLCLSFALWNERDPILKERLFGLTGPEGNHAEDPKELWYYLDATPTYSYAKALYKYPQARFPYEELVAVNRARGLHDTEYELLDSRAFEGSRYFDVQVEWAKASPDDLCVRLVVTNRGPERAPLHVLPTLWFRNTWSWGRSGDGYGPRPTLVRSQPVGGASAVIAADHVELGRLELLLGGAGTGALPLYFTENETNQERLYGVPNRGRYVKDAFHRRVVGGELGAVNPEEIGTKAAAHARYLLEPGASTELRLRLRSPTEALGGDELGEAFERSFERRISEADRFFEARTTPGLGEDERAVVRQARAGLLFTKQFYFYSPSQWREGDPGTVPPPAGRSRNREWDQHMFHREIISMPDKWEYPWYASWDLAFHMIPMAEVDPFFAKEQLVLFLREWAMHPSGQIPAYEWHFSDVNPPVFAWAAWRVYKSTARRGKRDKRFLARVFAKLLLNFTWWVNRKDEEGNNLFSGGFLGLDNIGVFDRSKPLPTGGRLAQADGTAWMAFFAANMLAIAFELASEPAAEDLASKFFEHFIAIADAMNGFGGTGLWDERDGFYYDQIVHGGHRMPLRIRSIVGLIPLFTAELLSSETLGSMPHFTKRMDWLLEHRQDLAKRISWMECPENDREHLRLLAIPSRERLERALAYVLDEREFLSPFGIRSLSLHHRDHPFVLRVGSEEHRVDYTPGESTSRMFGGNSNWRGPIWLPINYLLVEALERYHLFYGDSLRVECPTGSGNYMNLREVAREIARRLVSLFLPDPRGERPCFGRHRERYAQDPDFRELLLFHENFHADSGAGLGAEHQTGWTALVTRLVAKLHADEQG